MFKLQVALSKCWLTPASNSIRWFETSSLLFKASSTVDPLKTTKKKGRKEKLKPVRPQSAYNLFVKQNYAEIKAANGSLSFGDLSKLVATKWKATSTEDKSVRMLPIDIDFHLSITITMSIFM